MYQAVLTYDQRLIRRAVFSFWRRSVGIDLIAALLLLTGSLAVLLAAGDRSWLVGALGTVLVMGIVFAGAVYVIHSTNALRKLQEMGPPTASFQAEEASFTVTSAIGTATFHWSVIKELWLFNGYWLMLFSKAQFITLPLAGLAPELQAFILDRVRAAGGKVR